MTKLEWARIRYFRAGEGWGDPDLMVFDFLHTLDQFRAFLCIPMVLTPHGGTMGKHSEFSLHYSGMAADFVFPDPMGRSLLDIFIEATRFGFTEIGVYSDWKYQGKTIGGLHLGKKPDPLGRPRKYWMGVPNGTATSYLGVNVRNIVRRASLIGTTPIHESLSSIPQEVDFADPST